MSETAKRLRELADEIEKNEEGKVEPRSPCPCAGPITYTITTIGSTRVDAVQLPLR